MSKIIKIGLSKNKKGPLEEVAKVEAVKGMGLIGDRYYIVNNNVKCQITLIEIENIDFYNNLSNTKILPLSFRRNIITKNIKLNELLGKTFFIGKVKVKGHDLCRPCKYLQESLKKENIIKEFLLKGGLRCEILSSGIIYNDDQIIY